jgi:hypothetical protein
MANQYFRRRFKRFSGSMIETLESRTLLSESATAQLALVSTTGTQANPVYNYDITLANTGTTNIGTFWFAWIPGDDFLPSVPSAESSPSGWGDLNGDSTPTIEGAHDSTDGSSIQWIAQANSLLAPGQSLGGFDFSTTDSPSTLAGNSPTHAGTSTMTSFIYQGHPFSDSGDQFVVSPIAVSGSSGLQPILSGTLPDPIVLGSKTKITVPVTLTNLQATKVEEKASTKLYLAGGSLDGTQIQIASLAKKLTINGSGNITVNLPVSKIPAAVTAGSYFLIAAATDSSNTTLSTVSSTTITVAEPTINYAVTFTDMTQESPVAAGSTTSGQAVLSLTNNGNVPATGAKTVAIYASTAQNVASGTLIRSVKVGTPIAPGATVTVTVPFKKIPSTLSADLYYIVAQVIDPKHNSATAVAGSQVQVIP